MSKQFWGVIVAIVLVFIGIFALTGNKANDSTKKSSSQAGLTQHVQGNNSAGITLVEYGDYQCPYCQQYYPTVKQVQAEFNDQIKFQFRNFPLVNLHQNAFAAARAAEAAALQGKFWEMHDALYETTNYQVWTRAKDPTPYFTGYAEQLGLKKDQFNTDFASSKVNKLINADSAEATKLGVTGTPAFFLNGKKIEVGNSVASFQKVIKDELAKKGVKDTTAAAATETAPAAQATPAQ
ncbi:MAG: disulfide bond formation protein DsbA [Candidatus Saccharibacteria bacterium]|nr:disulfide bond formation protein DsbA [Candidatus Saccharibacteria bacterium]